MLPCNSCLSSLIATSQSQTSPLFSQYVNSYPVTAMRHGIQNLSLTHFRARPDIAVAGPNVGANLGPVVQISGTVGAATEAVKEGVPAIAFSGTTGSQTAWNASLEDYVTI